MDSVSKTSLFRSLVSRVREKWKKKKKTVQKRLGEFTNPWCFIKEINVIQQKEK